MKDKLLALVVIAGATFLALKGARNFEVSGTRAVPDRDAKKREPQYDEYGEVIYNGVEERYDMDISQCQCLSDPDGDDIRKLKGTDLIFEEECTGREFMTSIEEVLIAEIELQRLFQLRGWATLADFHTLLGMTVEDGEGDVGWGEVVGEVTYGYRFIDFVHKIKKDAYGYRCILRFPYAPTADYID